MWPVEVKGIFRNDIFEVRENARIVSGSLLHTSFKIEARRFEARFCKFTKVLFMILMHDAVTSGIIRKTLEK